MKVKELKKIISKLNGDVEIEIYVESGFGSSSYCSGNNIECYFDKDDNKVVFDCVEEYFE